MPLGRLGHRRLPPPSDSLPNAYTQFPQLHVPTNVRGRVKMAGGTPISGAKIEVWAYARTYGQGPMHRVVRAQSNEEGEYRASFKGRQGQPLVVCLFCFWHGGMIARHQSILLGKDWTWDFVWAEDPSKLDLPRVGE